MSLELERWEHRVKCEVGSSKLSLRNHPALADHPSDPGRKLVVDGKFVPLFPEQRGIYLDDLCIGYVSDPPACNVAIIYPQYAGVIDQVRELVRRERGHDPKNLHVVKAMPQQQSPDDFDETLEDCD